MKKFMRSIGFYILMLLSISLLLNAFNGKKADEKLVPYSSFLKMIEKGEVVQIHVVENDAVALKSRTSIAKKDFPNKKYDVLTYLPSVDTFMDDLETLVGTNPMDKGLSVTFEAPPEPSFLETMLPYLVLFGLMAAFVYFMMAQQGGSNNRVMNFGRSRARLNTGNQNKKTFADVAGAEEEKEEMAEIVDFLRNPRKYIELGARIPKGVLLVGPPGTGKTLLARAVAGEANVAFYSISGSDFVEMFVGVGASRVRDLFENAKKNAPCIVFIDEIDAVGRQRGSGMGGGHDEREQTLNQLLVEMDGFSKNEGIIVLAATNRPDILDPALLRPGRFDRQITVNAPDAKGREDILRVHTKGMPLDKDVDLALVAKRTPWRTGADLENVANEAAILAARRNKDAIGMDELMEAITKTTIGPEKRSAKVTEHDRRLVAYHETGHAIVAHYLPGCDPVQEVSIVPRGEAGGYTMTLSDEETRYMTKSAMYDNIVMMLGGRACEELTFGDVTTGASSDLKNATGLARRMVVEFGMSERVGTIYYGGQHEVFIGRDFGQVRPYSESVAAVIDEEVKTILDTQLQQARTILTERKAQVDAVAARLLEVEKLDHDAFLALLEEQVPALEEGAQEAAPADPELVQTEEEPVQTDIE